MPTVSLTGNDTVIINGTIFNDLADAACAALTFPQTLTTIKTGKNGNSLYAFNTSGKQCKLVLRVIRGSANDKMLNEQLSLYKQNPPAFTLMTGQLVKNVGDGTGNMVHDTYQLSGGIFENETDVSENADGDIEQAVSVYKLAFTNAPRQIA
jgi:hypothetical protein